MNSFDGGRSGNVELRLTNQIYHVEYFNCFIEYVMEICPLSYVCYIPLL